MSNILSFKWKEITRNTRLTTKRQGAFNGTNYIPLFSEFHYYLLDQKYGVTVTDQNDVHIINIYLC